jgi:hypothetical protein
MYIPPWAFHMKTISTFDIDGVIYFGKDSPGVRPGPDDIIITGRSWEESAETLAWCSRFGIKNQIHFSVIPKHLKTREISGFHKALTLRELSKSYKIDMHFEDDPVQIEIIESMVPEVKVVHLVHNLTQK